MYDVHHGNDGDNDINVMKVENKLKTIYYLLLIHAYQKINLSLPSLSIIIIISLLLVTGIEYSVIIIIITF